MSLSGWERGPPARNSSDAGGTPALPRGVLPRTKPVEDNELLFVDDVTANCQEIRGYLKDHCRQVTICTSPLRALRRLKAEAPDLLITTLLMKELGGFDVIRRMRGQGSSVPIVMITGYGNEKTAIEATRLGVSDYLEKPVATDELRARLEKIFAAQHRPAASAEATVADAVGRSGDEGDLRHGRGRGAQRQPRAHPR